MFEYKISLEDLDIQGLSLLVGNHDQNLRLLEELFECKLFIDELQLIMQRSQPTNTKQFERVISLLKEELNKKTILDRQLVRYIFDEALRLKSATFNAEAVGRRQNGQAIYPKTMGQKMFVDTMSSNDIIFALGPAGTGKTYLAVILAVTMLKKGEFKKIVLTRPAVEAGESLGFLPGDLKEKVDPYLTPLYDALYEMLGQEATQKLIDKNVIEIAPLAYMRGRTLNEAFVILDEAQNTTASQMKMFLTRLGYQSKMIITGDATQVDLKIGKENGLVDASNRLQGIERIGIITLGVKDIVRHPLVQKIIERYEIPDKKKG